MNCHNWMKYYSYPPVQIKYFVERPKSTISMSESVSQPLCLYDAEHYDITHHS